jgi:hypothetical protein
VTKKRFAVIAVIVFAILLVAGNFATPVSATNSIGVISTPTSTSSAGEPSSLRETTSVELQDELKSVIQAYFELRYQALSASQPDGFRLDGFGDLVSDGADARVFWMRNWVN